MTDPSRLAALSYCTNVHPAETLDGVLDQLDRYAVPVRQLVGVDALGLGLWLSAPVARQLADDRLARRRLKRELTTRGLTVRTLNAFPYRGFHEPVVKHAVYHPRWTEQARLDYTVDCATVLADLLPDDAAYGSVSTLPLGWRAGWGTADDDRATVALAQAVEALRAIEARHGRPVRLAVEPEPGCVLDTVADAVSWLAGRVDPHYVGICLDTCHLAVSFADPATEVDRIAAAGLRVVKVQASAALEVAEPGDPVARRALSAFVEPRYLHQVRELGADGTVLAADDLPEALAGLPADGPWRVHFHVPLHARPAPPLGATTDVLRAAVAAVLARVEDPDDEPHIEVETYTWSVLPEAQGLDDVAMARGIAAEMRWAGDHLLPLASTEGDRR